MPLLEETGAALAKYVLHVRPVTTDRRVFLSCVPPVRPFCHSSNISRIVRFRLERAGMRTQRGGAHLLRHSPATRLVEKRLPIKEVADLIQAWLGHAQVATTHRYAAADVEMMRRSLDKAAIRGSAAHRFQPKDAVLSLLERL